MKDRIIAVLKTVCQWAVTSVVAWAAARGWTLAPEVEAALFAVLLAAVTFGVNLLAEKWSWLRIPTAKY